MESSLKIPLTSTRDAIRVTVGISRINDNDEVEEYLPPFHDIISTLNLFNDVGIRYYCIMHNKDGNYVHYHLVLIARNRRKMKTWLNNISDAFQCNVDNVQMLDCPDITLAVQYLIHKNDFDKYQYDSSLIMTNDSRDHLDLILNEKVSYAECMTMQEVITLVHKASSLEQVYLSLSPRYLKENISWINSLCRRHGLL